MARSPLKKIKMHFRRAIVLWTDDNLTTFRTEGESWMRPVWDFGCPWINQQGGKKLLSVGVSQLKNWCGQEKRASNIQLFWMICNAGEGAGPAFAIEFSPLCMGIVTCCACQITRAQVHQAWNILVYSRCWGYLCKFTGKSWKQVLES